VKRFRVFRAPLQPLFKGIPIHVFIAGRSIRDAASPVEAARQFKRSIAELWG
jgi:3-dehydro-L-gulonate-6-phosphate decarboxylase